MKKTLLPILLLLCSFSMINAQHDHEEPNPNISPYKDAYVAMTSASKTHLLKSEAWTNFQSKYPSWGAHFNTYSGMPHRAFGSPITFAAGGNNVELKAKSFLEQELSGFNIPTQEFALTRNYNDGKFKHVDFKQVHNGMEVLFSRAAVRFGQNNEILLVGLDVYNDIPNSLENNISAAQAKQIAEAGVSTTITSSSVAADKKIIALPFEGKNDYRIVYEVMVETQNSENTPGKYITYVDAKDGKIVYRDNEVRHVDFKAEANIHETNLFTPAVNLPLQHLRVTNGASTLYTDANGDLTIAGASATPTFHLDGRYVEVVTGQNGNTVASFSPTISSNGPVLWPAVTTAQPQVQHFTAYHHVNVVHDFMKSKLPTFLSMDNPLLCRVDRTDGDCNAFYNGSSINFYTTANGCNSLSRVNTVIYHEYGHGITNVFWDWQGVNFANGAVGEGYSDFWSMSITDDPIVGRGFFVNQPNSFIRRYDQNPKVYPQDLVGQVHADGEIICGAWWAVQGYWNNLTEVSQLFADTHFGTANGANGTEGEVYYDILIDALQYDDDDNDLTNGTPHFNDIVQGFADHGIYLLNNTELMHDDIGPVNSGTSIAIQTDIVSDFPAFLGDGKMFYREKGTTQLDSVLMTKSGNIYTTTFPSTTGGKIWEYYFAAYDNANSYSVVSPSNAEFNLSAQQRNLPHFLLVGYRNVWQEQFNNGSPSGWTVGNAAGDNATRGLWDVGIPIPSFGTQGDTSTMVQTYFDADGGGGCAYTGNGSGPTASFGQEDVDGGVTTLISPTINIASYNQPAISYLRWYSNEAGQNPGKDFWTVEISYNGGSNWFPLEKTFEADRSWRRNVVPLVQSAGTDILLRFIAQDINQGQGGAIVEAAVDAVEIYELGETPVGLQGFESLNVLVYPNPASNEINVVLPENGTASYQIMSTSGQVVLQRTVETVRTGAMKIDASSLSDGIYYVQIQQNGKRAVKKVTILN